MLQGLRWLRWGKDNERTLSTRALSTRYTALVPAAGAGARLGAPRPKQYVPLFGKPMLWHTLHTLGSHPQISNLYVVLSADDRYFASVSGIDHVTATALRCGGETRARSVLNGLLAIRADLSDEDWVLVHDAARPCLSHALIDRMISSLEWDAVGGIAALPVRDTIKRADRDQRIEVTVSRQYLWQAQTPQMFRYGVLLRAMQAADLDVITDEASAVEALGLQPQLIAGEPTNIKVTFEQDIALAEMILKHEDNANE